MSKPYFSWRWMVAAAPLMLSLLLPVFAADVQKKPAKSPAQLVNEATQLLDSWRGERGILIEAQKLLADALTLDPKFAPAYAESGRLLIKASIQGDSLNPALAAQAEQMLKAGTKADPKYAKNYTLLGYLYANTGDLPNAKKALEQADTIGTTDPWQQLNWADYWKEMGEPKQQVKHCRKVMDSGIDNKQILGVAVACVHNYYATVEPDRAMADSTYARALKLDPSSAYLRGNYARHLILHFLDFDAAEKLARETITVMDYPHVRQTLSLALYSRWAKAVEEKKDKKTIDALLAKAQAEDPDGSMIPGCAMGYFVMDFLQKALEAKAKEGNRAYTPLQNC
jgi:tetratricopeptide (TPR) repeat protein